MEVGTIAQPAWTWNVFFTIGGLISLGLGLGMIQRKWFKDMNSAAELRYQLYTEEAKKMYEMFSSKVCGKQDVDLCEKEHQIVEQRCATHEQMMKDICLDVKDVKRGVNNILTHLTGINHG